MPKIHSRKSDINQDKMFGQNKSRPPWFSVNVLLFSSETLSSLREDAKGGVASFWHTHNHTLTHTETHTTGRLATHQSLQKK